MRHAPIALLGCLWSALAGCGAEVDLGERGSPVTNDPAQNNAQVVGVGDPCIPVDESEPTMPGFVSTELALESRIFLGKSLVCLVNHFRGRVTCPLGQDAALAAKAQAYTTMRNENPGTTLADAGFSEAEQAQVCRVSGFEFSETSPAVVQTVVQPQCTSRQAQSTVYYSCRCDGNDPNGTYCVCPETFECTRLPEVDLGVSATGSSSVGGSYCVKTSDLTTTKEGQRVVTYQAGDCPSDPDGHPANSCDAASLNCGVANNVEVLY